MLEILLSKKVIGPIIIILGFAILYLILKKVINKTLYNDDKRKKTIASLIKNILKYFFLILGTLMILNIYGIDTTALITSLGVVGVVAGLALQDVLKDFLAGLSIITENQYSVGDNVTINDFRGEVLAIGIKTTKLRAYTGEVKFIANRNITEVTNHSLANSLAVVEVGVDYNDDIVKVEQVLNKLFERLNKELPYLKGEINLLGVEDLGNSAVIFKITVETESLKHFEIQRRLKKEIKMEFDKNNITIPFNQVVIHNGL